MIWFCLILSIIDLLLLIGLCFVLKTFWNPTAKKLSEFIKLTNTRLDNIEKKIRMYE